MRVLILIAGLLAAACQSAPAAQVVSAEAGQPIVLGQGYHIASAALDEVRRVNIYLPAGYTRGEQRYPVLYLIDGGVDQVASLLAYFTDERAEMRLIIDNQIGEFGFGRNHLNECLKRLAVVEATFEPRENGFSTETLEEVFDVRENSYTFFVTAQNKDNLPDQLNQRAKVLSY